MNWFFPLKTNYAVLPLFDKCPAGAAKLYPLFSRAGFAALFLLALVQNGWGQLSDCNLTLCNDDACGPAFVTYAPSGQNVFCEGSVITLANTSTTTDFQVFYIDWGDGQQDTVNNYNNVTHTYDYSGIDRCAEGPLFNQIICYVGRKTCANGESCNTSTTVVTVRLRPVARFDAPAEACVNTPINFTQSSCNVGNDGYLWNFGDGNTSTEPSPSHTYANPGNYTVTLTVSNSCGSDTQSRPIRVVAPPEAAFDFDPALGCGPTVISFTDQSNQWSNTVWSIMPNDTSRWDFTDTTMTLSTDDISVNFHAVGEYIVTLTASNACGQDTETATINIYAPPSISLSPPHASCDELILTSDSLGFYYSGEITTFEWVFTNGTPATATGPSFSGIVFTQSGTVTLNITSPCGNQTRSVPVTVANTAPIVFGSNPSSLCANAAPVFLQATPDGQWSGPGISPDGELNPVGLSPDTYTYTYSTGGMGCPNDATLDIQIEPAVEAAIMAVDTACESLSYTPQVTYGGEINAYAWSFPGGTPASSTQANPSGIQYNAPGTYLATLEAVGPCGTARDTVEIIVQANVQLEITPPPGILCSGSAPFELTANQPGGTWSGQGIIDGMAGLFDPGAVIPGQPISIQYELENGACSATASIELTVVASANITFPADTFCLDSEPRLLSISPANGTFSGVGVDSMSGLFTPTTSGEGVFEIRYDYTDANGCAVNAQADILVEAVPQLGLPDTALLCLSSIAINLPATVGFAPQPPGGAATWSGPGIQNPQGDFNAGTLSEGVYPVTVEYHRNDCLVRDTIMVEITQPQPLQISLDTTVCISEQFLQLQSNLAGGQWFGPGIDSDGRIELEVAGGNTIHEYRYEFAVGTNCEQNATVRVEIIDLGALVNAGPDTAICAGPATFALSGAAPQPGYWVGPGLADDQAGLLDLSQLSPDSLYTFQYCIESQAVAGCQACDSRSFIVYSNPVADFALDGTACIDEVFGVQNNSSGADQFRWNFGDGTIIPNQASPTHQYTAAGNYTIQLIATNAATSCRDTTEFSLFVTTPPVAAFTLDDDEGCAPFPLAIQDGSSGFEITRTWFVAGDTVVGAPPVGVILDGVTQDSIFIIRLETTNLCGTRSAAAEVLIRPYPIVRFGVFPGEGCSPLEVELANATVGNPQTYFWDLGNGTTSADTLPPFPVYTTTDTTVSTYTITLISTNDCGTDTLSKEVIVYPPDVHAFIEADTLEGCQPLVVQLESFSTPGAIVSWLILGPDGSQQGSNLNAPLVVLDVPGQHTVILYATRCGTAADTVYIEVLPAPLVSFTHRPFICVGQPVSFTNTSLQIGGSNWDFGDGNLSTDFSPTHIFDTPGEYTVTLTAYSLLNNCPATFASTIQVIGNPTAAFTPSATSGCGPLTIEFASNSTPGVNHVWDFGDGGTAAFVPNPVHTFQQPGNYAVTLTVYDADSCFTAVAVSNIFVFPDPVADFSLPDERYCLGYAALQPVNLSQDAVSYCWRWENDTVCVAAPVIVPQAAGSFELQLVATNAFECQDTFARLVDILPSAIASPAPSPMEGCQPLRVAFDNPSQHASTFLWLFGDGNSSTLPLPSHSYLEAGDFEGLLIAGSTNGCPSDTGRFAIQVWPKPDAGFAFDKPEECGAPMEVAFENLSALAQSADWDFGDGNTSTALNPTHLYLTPGTYPARLIVANIYQCRDTTEQIIDIYGQPIADFRLDNPIGCEGKEIVFQNLSEEALRYEWRIEPFTELFTDPEPQVRFDQPGIYSVQLIAIYNERCRDTLLRPAYVRIYASPLADFTYEADREPNILGDVVFINQSQNADRFFWDFGDGTTTTASDPEHEYDINRSIEVLLVAYNDNGGAFTCADSIIQPIEPEWITTFYAPNALSPGYGAEGVQVFKPVGIGLAEYRIAIYSPWGEQVWYSEALEEGQPAESWNGAKHNQGDILPQGAYTWRADLTFVNGVRRTEVGSVTLLR